MSRPDKMLGLFKTAKGPGNMVLRESPVPKPEGNEVLIEVKAAGICGTDIHIKHLGPGFDLNFSQFQNIIKIPGLQG